MVLSLVLYFCPSRGELAFPEEYKLHTPGDNVLSLAKRSSHSVGKTVPDSGVSLSIIPLPLIPTNEISYLSPKSLDCANFGKELVKFLKGLKGERVVNVQYS